MYAPLPIAPKLVHSIVPVYVPSRGGEVLRILGVTFRCYQLLAAISLQENCQSLSAQPLCLSLGRVAKIEEDNPSRAVT